MTNWYRRWKRDDRGWPKYLPGGRMRTSTAAMLVAFVALFWVYQSYESPPAAAPAQVIPPGFVPDPAYTWVPRTNVERPAITTETTTSPTTTETTTETTSPTGTTGPAPTTFVDPDGPGPLPPTPVTPTTPSTSPALPVPNRSGTPTTTPTTTDVPGTGPIPAPPQTPPPPG